MILLVVNYKKSRFILTLYNEHEIVMLIVNFYGLQLTELTQFSY